MKQILITGSNGMIGKLILEYCLAREDVARVTTIARKQTGITHPKLLEVLHNDFLDYSGIEQHFENIDICFFCIGVYTDQVPKAAFNEITIDFTRAFAEMLKQKSPETAFCFLSGQGADSSEKSPILFAKAKGIAENILIGLKFKQLGIFRPGYIYPVTPRVEPNRRYYFFRAIYKPFLSKIYPNIGVSSEQLARAMMIIGFNGGNKIIYENRDIRQLMPE
jgi:uncharacterized protein YbjT (DUF2867 family)